MSTGFGLSARIPQIIMNLRQGHTGQLSLVSWSFSLAGSAVRIFTTLMEVPDKLILFMFTSSFLCNLTLVLQILYYWKQTNEVLSSSKVSFSVVPFITVASHIHTMRLHSGHSDLNPTTHRSIQSRWNPLGEERDTQKRCPQRRERVLSWGLKRLMHIAQSSGVGEEKSAEGNMTSSCSLQLNRLRRGPTQSLDTLSVA